MLKHQESVYKKYHHHLHHCYCSGSQERMIVLCNETGPSGQDVNLWDLWLELFRSFWQKINPCLWSVSLKNSLYRNSLILGMHNYTSLVWCIKLILSKHCLECTIILHWCGASSWFCQTHSLKLNHWILLHSGWISICSIPGNYTLSHLCDLIYVNLATCSIKFS